MFLLPLKKCITSDHRDEILSQLINPRLKFVIECKAFFRFFYGRNFRTQDFLPSTSLYSSGSAYFPYFFLVDIYLSAFRESLWLVKVKSSSPTLTFISFRIIIRIFPQTSRYSESFPHPCWRPWLWECQSIMYLYSVLPIHDFVGVSYDVFFSSATITSFS